MKINDFNSLVNKVLNLESKALLLPDSLNALVDDLLGKIKKLCDEDLWKRGRVRLRPEVEDPFGEEQYERDSDGVEYPIDPMYIDQYEYDLSKYIATNKNERFLFVIYANTKKGNIGGNASVARGRINLYLPYSKDKQRVKFVDVLRQHIVHELMHIIDPTLSIDTAMRVFDNNIGALSLGKEHKYDIDDISQYLTFIGYRSGKIPLEFAPRMDALLRYNPAKSLKLFLKYPNAVQLPYEDEFAKEMLKDPYLKRKLLEKIYHFLASTGHEVSSMTFAGLSSKGRKIYVFDSNEEPVIYKVLKNSNKESIWDDWRKSYSDGEGGELTNTVKSFDNYQDFYNALIQFIEDNNIRGPYKVDIMNALIKFKELEHLDGVYKLLANEEHAALLFGKEVY